MISMLVALGIWDGIWPGYTDSMLLEVYRSTDDKNQAFFRWLRSGKPLQLPWCRSSDLGLCNVKDFLPKDIRELRDSHRYAQECAISTTQEDLHLPVPITASLALQLSLAAAISLCSLVCGCMIR